MIFTIPLMNCFIPRSLLWFWKGMLGTEIWLDAFENVAPKSSFPETDWWIIKSPISKELHSDHDENCLELLESRMDACNNV